MDNLVTIKNKTFPIDWIEDISPEKQMVLLINKKVENIKSFNPTITLGNYSGVVVDSPEQFNLIKFNLIKRAKQASKPEDRVMNWEANNKDGCFCLKRYEKLIHSRKTHQEINNEKKQEDLLMKIFKDNGLNYRRVR
jgi:hypothetical protein